MANPRWSWGSWHEATNRIFLRVWAHDHIEAQDQAQMVRLLREDWTRTSAGYNERARHIESIRSGAEAFGVVATAAPRGAGHIRIQSYDSRSLVRLGALVRWEKDPTSVFALIGPSVPVTQIGTQTRSVGGEAADIAELIARRDLEGDQRAVVPSSMRVWVKENSGANCWPNGTTLVPSPALVCKRHCEHLI